MIVRVPGNLLLFGEYAVTIPGGKGIALAIDTWVQITAEKADRMIISCHFRNAQYYWPSEDLTLIDNVLKAVSKLVNLAPAKIAIHSSSFYHEDGKKKGYGSSAAVTAGLTYLLLHQAYAKAPDIYHEVYPLALSIHREFQGGRGSGYDIAASLFGGAGLFTGGALPTWNPLSLPWLNQLFLIRGTEETSTKNALTRFNAFRDSYPEEIAQFVSASNALVEMEDPYEMFKRGAALNRWIHAKLDIPTFDPQLEIPFKPLGAGGEIAAVLTHKNQNRWVPLKVSSGGIQCLL